MAIQHNCWLIEHVFLSTRTTRKNFIYSAGHGAMVNGVTELSPIARRTAVQMDRILGESTSPLIIIELATLDGLGSRLNEVLGEAPDESGLLFLAAMPAIVHALRLFLAPSPVAEGRH